MPTAEKLDYTSNMYFNYENVYVYMDYAFTE